MICSYCGLETGSPTAHETQEACIEALRSQVSELRSVLRHSRLPGEPLGLPDNAVAQEVGTGTDLKRPK